MAIDADLNAGLISQDEALQRRDDVSREADFYGAMDGASKFVRGDAVAGIFITVVNIIGGILIGFAARLARGCTSGLALVGGAELAVGSWTFMLCVFAGGYAAAYFVRKQWL